MHTAFITIPLNQIDSHPPLPSSIPPPHNNFLALPLCFSGWVYTCFLRNLSQFVALYSLVMFYHGAVKLLQPLKPLQKFLSIKLIIFFTFWQKLVLVGLKHYEMLPVGNLYQDQYMNSSHVTEGNGTLFSEWNDDISSEEKFNDLASAGIQNLLICIEMFVAAFARECRQPLPSFRKRLFEQKRRGCADRTVFSYKDFRTPEGEGGLSAPDTRQPFASALWDMVNPKGVIDEVSDLTGHVGDAAAEGVGGLVGGLASVVGLGAQPEPEPDAEPEAGGGAKAVQASSSQSAPSGSI